MYNFRNTAWVDFDCNPIAISHQQKWRRHKVGGGGRDKGEEGIERKIGEER
jgi:hypothetical protein